MGREITGVRVEYNKSSYAKVMPKVSIDLEQKPNPKSPEGNSELKNCEVKECPSEVSGAEVSRENQEVLGVKSTNFKTEKDQKLSSPDKTTSGTPASGNVKMKETQKPTVTVDMQTYESPRAVATPISPTPSNSKSPNSTRKTQPTTPLTARKPLDDEDTWSNSSSTRTTRSRTTVGIAPTFSSSERLEKRKEYYAQLEEKRKALEAEKLEYEARTKEDEDAAIKQLRKNMVVRANPVPSFYYEAPPPKKELKKLPTTRAVSPKLGRRKSCSDAVCSSSSEDKICGRAFRRSVGGPTQSSIPKKDPLVKDRLKQAKEAIKKNSPAKVSKQTNSDIAVQ